MKELQQKVLNWAEDKNLLSKDNIQNQLKKFIEETEELRVEILAQNHDKAKMELGDVLVTLVILADQLDTDLENCLNLAYQKIRNRKGKTINGTFVKEEDLKNEKE